MCGGHRERPWIAIPRLGQTFEDDEPLTEAPDIVGGSRHRRPDIRGRQVGRQDFGGSPPPRRQGSVDIGKAGLVPAGLGMAEQPEEPQSGASVRGIVPGDDWRCADSFGGGPMASRADPRVDPLL